jgi:antitoxin component YwqK of YwqJK toxin-antitoxin module
MKNSLIISLLILSVGFSQKEYDINHVLEKKGVYIKKFSDEEVNGSAYQMFGDIKMDLGYIKNGEKEGLWTWWFENGEKKNEGTFKDGKENGLHKWWYENGHKSEERTYKNGKKDGLWTKWYENGQKGIEGTYKDGLEFGLWTYYNEDGSIKEVKEYPSPN